MNPSKEFMADVRSELSDWCTECKKHNLRAGAKCMACITHGIIGKIREDGTRKETREERKPS